MCIRDRARVLLGWVGRLFLVGVDVVEHRLAARRALVQRVDDLRRLVRIDVVVPDQPQVAERVRCV